MKSIGNKGYCVQKTLAQFRVKRHCNNNMKRNDSLEAVITSKIADGQCLTDTQISQLYDARCKDL
jgi:hypothetical protein